MKKWMLLLSFCMTQTYAQTWEWAVKVNPNDSEAWIDPVIVSDDAENVYLLDMVDQGSNHHKLLKYDAAGLLVFSYSFFVNGSFRMAANAQNVFLAGYFRDTLNFQNGSHNPLHSLGENDLVLMKFSSTGSLLNVIHAGTASEETASAISLTRNGNILVSGTMSDVLMVGSYTFPADSVPGVYLARMDQGLNVSSANRIGKSVRHSDGSVVTYNQTKPLGVYELSNASIVTLSSHGYGKTTFGNDTILPSNTSSLVYSFLDPSLMNLNSYSRGNNLYFHGAAPQANNIISNFCQCGPFLNQTVAWKDSLAGFASNYSFNFTNDGVSLNGSVGVDSLLNAYYAGDYSNDNISSPLFEGESLASQFPDGSFIARKSLINHLDYLIEIPTPFASPKISVTKSGVVYMTGSYEDPISLGGVNLQDGGTLNRDYFLARLSAQPTGIRKNDITSINVFPNPANEMITIITDGEGTAEVLIINGLGETTRAGLMNKGYPLNLRIADLPAGFYLVIIRDNTKTEIRKIVIE